MSDPNQGNTLALSLTKLEPSFTAVVDPAFTSAISKTEAGGDGTRAYFDSLSQTSDFWSLLGAGVVTFAPGLDPKGRPILMASDGNVDLRVQAVWAPADSGQVGVLTVTTREVSGTGISRFVSAGVVVADNPSKLTIDEKVFGELLPSLYESASGALQALAAAFAEASRVESPDIDAESITSMALFAASQKAIGAAASLIQYGIDFVAVTWGEIAGELLGVGALMAIPAIVEFLGHTMRHSIVLENLTGVPLSWSLTTVHGESVIQQPATPVAGQRTGPDPLAPQQSLTLSSDLHLLHVNTTRLTSLGYVLTLTPQGGPTFQALVNVPWAGDNLLWVGATTQSASTVWDLHHGDPAPGLAVHTSSGGHRVDLSIDKLSGTTDDAYFYCSSLVVAAG